MTTAMTRKIALGLGVFYIGLGVLGFVPGAPLGGLAVDPTHNFAHLFVGLIALWGSQSASARAALTGTAAVLAALMLIPLGAPIASLALYVATAALAGYLALADHHATTNA